MGMTKQQREALEARLTVVLTAEPHLLTGQLTERFRCGAYIIQKVRKKLELASPGSSGLLNKQDIKNSRIPERIPCQPMRAHYRRF
jgi:hypothetical protein